MTPLPVLLIHGINCTGAVWDRFTTVLAEAGHRCDAPTLAADRRRSIRAPAGLAELTFTGLVNECAGRARMLADESGRLPVVIGHSMGGLIAQKLAEAGLAAGAVLIAPAKPPEVTARPGLAQLFTFANVILARRKGQAVHKIWRTGFRWGVLNRTPTSRHAAICDAAVFDSTLTFAALGGPATTPQRREASIDAARVTVPVLVLVGTDDRVTPPAAARAVAQYYPGSGYHDYAGRGHWIIDEPGAETIASDIAAWIADRDAA